MNKLTEIIKGFGEFLLLADEDIFRFSNFDLSVGFKL